MILALGLVAYLGVSVVTGAVFVHLEDDPLVGVAGVMWPVLVPILLCGWAANRLLKWWETSREV